jgi:hypothetical protein
MLESYFVRLQTADRIRAAWLGPAIEHYVAWLTERRTHQVISGAASPHSSASVPSRAVKALAPGKTCLRVSAHSSSTSCRSAVHGVAASKSIARCCRSHGHRSSSCCGFWFQGLLGTRRDP